MRPISIQKIERSKSFNPRICKRCDQKNNNNSTQSSVSIHASVKDATIGSAYIRARKDVSIHASVKDATLLKCLRLENSCSFNPRICKRCDIKAGGFHGIALVSIHASVKDATTSGFMDFSKTAVSIHASVKDATPLLFSFLLLKW